MREVTMFLDADGYMIDVGDTVRAEIKINHELHGTWVDYVVKKAPGGYKLSYLIAEKGQTLPVDYSAGYMVDSLPASDEIDLKTLVFTLKPIRVKGWKIVSDKRDRQPQVAAQPTEREAGLIGERR